MYQNDDEYVLIGKQQKAKVRYISRPVVWFLAAAIGALSLCPDWLRPVTRVPHEFEHFVIYLAAGIAFGYAYPYRIFYQTSTLVIFAAGLELAQLLVPGRHARLSDFFLNTFGGFIGIALALMIRRVSKSRSCFDGKPQLHNLPKKAERDCHASPHQ